MYDKRIDFYVSISTTTVLICYTGMAKNYVAFEAFLSDSILLKNEARWVKKTCSAPNGGSLKEMHEKEAKG